MRTRLAGILVGLTFLSIALLPSGCPPQDNPGDPNGDPEFDAPASLAEQLRDLEEIVDGVPDADPITEAQALVSDLQQNPQFEAVGLNDDNSVWARFSDGQPIVIVFVDDNGVSSISDANAKPLATAQPFAGSQGYSRYELPEGSRAWVLRGPGTPISAVNEISQWLASVKYSVHPTHRADIDTLGRVDNAAILHVETHGGVYRPKDEPAFYAICTTEECAPTTIPARGDDWSKRVIVPMTIRWTDINGQLNTGTYDAITDLFVEEFMSFAPDALVSIGACSSQCPEAASFRTAFWKGGASAFLGWTTEVTRGDLLEASRHFFGRTLGMNKVSPASPPRRPFDFDETMSGLAGYTHLKLSHRLDGAPPRAHTTWALRPAICGLEIDEAARQLTIRSQPDIGTFGTRQGRVTIGGDEVPASSTVWDQGEIIVTNLSPEASGAVQVWVGDIASNKRWITLWRDVHIHQTWRGHGTLFFTNTYDFPTIQDDITDYVSGDSTLQELVPSGVTPGPGAQFSWTAGGTYTDGYGNTTMWVKRTNPEVEYLTEGCPQGGAPAYAFCASVGGSVGGAGKLYFLLDVELPEMFRVIGMWSGSVFLDVPFPMTNGIPMLIPAEEFVGGGSLTNADFGAPSLGIATFTAEWSVGSIEGQPDRDAP